MAGLDPATVITGTLFYNSLPKWNRHMTRTPCQNAATITALFATIVETILTILAELGACCREVALLRHKAGFLAPAASALSVLARKRSPEFERAVMMDNELSLRARVRAARPALSPAIGASWARKTRGKGY
ncbi:hypothetical protein [Taklimakanibacter deserti]|uniref:hypothetical protein n=1 Tax=Taklimakanibacter deserti TaxID=2267839 RepID=UPI000E64D663